MDTKYKNARKVLPPELYKEVCKYGTGHWWFAPDRPDHKDDVRAKVIEMAAKGVSTREIAAEVNRSARRVQQIIVENDISIRDAKFRGLSDER